MMIINLLRSDQKRERRMVLQDCLNLMWEEFSQIVPREDQARIGRFLMVKDIGQTTLAQQVPRDRKD